MKELNGNEKFFDLPNNLPANASNQATIQTGDLMLYGSTTLVLFYKSFSTSYSYTPLGRIDNTSLGQAQDADTQGPAPQSRARGGLAAVLGSGDVTVTFALQ